MKKGNLIVALLIALTLMLTACSRGVSADLVGSWESDFNALTFNSNGTGVETIEGKEFAFTWREIGVGLLVFTFDEDAEDSLIYQLMSLVIHGQPVGSFRVVLSDDLQTLILSDNHGHGHFNFALSRI